MNRDKIGTQTCYDTSTYLHWYIDVYSMSVSQSCSCSFLCNHISNSIYLSLVLLQVIILTITCSPYPLTSGQVLLITTHVTELLRMDDLIVGCGC